MKGDGGVECSVAGSPLVAVVVSQPTGVGLLSSREVQLAPRWAHHSPGSTRSRQHRAHHGSAIVIAEMREQQAVDGGG